MNANLPNNIEFIYGPPGTGKTTELVKQVHDILENEKSAKILVLTPTNKAADVVALKMSDDDISDCLSELAQNGYIKMYIIGEFDLLDKTIIYMENRFKNGAIDVLNFLSNLVP